MFWDLSSPAAAAKLLQSCPTLWDPIDGSPSGSTVPGILQARTLEWVELICRVYHEKHRAGRSTSWNQDCWENR